jgi:hypothetical protein
MLALSIRQPFAELILRGIKTVEYRTRQTRIIGERFHIYAAGKKWTGATRPVPTWSRDLSTATQPAPWMVELANALRLFPHELPTGVIVGSAVIERCEEVRDQKSEISNVSGLTSDVRPRTPLFKWHLLDVERAKTFRKPKNHPQPVWFKPF